MEEDKENNLDRKDEIEKKKKKKRSSLERPNDVNNSGKFGEINNLNDIYLTPPLGQDMTQGRFFKRSLTGLNSEYSFS